MPDYLGVIPIAPDPPVCPLERLLGVPIVFWCVNNLRRAIPLERIVIATDHLPVIDRAAQIGVQTIRFADALTQDDDVLVHEPTLPFCSLATIHQAIELGVRELDAVRTTQIERVRIESRNDLDFARAVARGLPPDDPCVIGVSRLRLPLGVDVRGVVCDVDGVLTDGRIAIGSGGVHTRAFHMHDGMGVRLLRSAGIEIGWLSAGADDGTIRARADRIGVAHVDVGEGDKGPRFDRLCQGMGVEQARTIYLGDDVNDLPAMARAALTACPADARSEVRAVADLLLDAAGGHGAFRELADVLLDEVRLRESCLAARGDSGSAAP